VGGSWLPQTCAVALPCWKIKNSLEIWRMATRNCCNSITLKRNGMPPTTDCHVGHFWWSGDTDYYTANDRQPVTSFWRVIVNTALSRWFWHLQCTFFGLWEVSIYGHAEWWAGLPAWDSPFLFYDLLLRSYLYHCVWSVITAHNLTPLTPTSCLQNNIHLITDILPCCGCL